MNDVSDGGGVPLQLSPGIQAKAAALIVQEQQDHALEEVEDRARKIRKIELTERPLREISSDVLASLQVWNNPPQLFIRGGRVVRIVTDEDGAPVVQMIEEMELRHVLERACDFVRYRAAGGKHDSKKNPQWEEIPVPPPLMVVQDLHALPAALWGLPRLVGINESPVLHEDGSFAAGPGYDTATRLYLHTSNISLPAIPDRPSRDEITASISLLEEMIVDFPFHGTADRSNFFAALLTVVLRPMICGSVPLFAIDKNQAGTGGTLLANVIAVVATGREGALTTAPTEEEAWGKKIFSLLLAGRNFNIFDNVELKLHSPSLAAIITAGEWQDRVLGRSEMLKVPVRTTWICTGNNILLGGDLPRRTVWIRLVATEARPWQREGFRHPDLLVWVQENRNRILAAIFTLSRAWMDAGHPDPIAIPRMGSFESWRSVVGGVLVHCGQTDLLGNLEELYESVDQDAPQLDLFLSEVHERTIGKHPFTVAELARFMENENSGGEDRLTDFLPDQLSESWERKKGFSRALGRYLTRRQDQITASGLVLHKKGISHSAVRWEVVINGEVTPLTPPRTKEGGVQTPPPPDEKGSYGESAPTQCVSEGNESNNGQKVTPRPPLTPPISYAGMNREQLRKILEQHLPHQPPDPESFREAWTAARAI